MVDEMIAFVRSSGEGGREQSLDVLKQGLGMLPQPDSGVDAARLLLVMSEFEHDASNWEAAANHGIRSAQAAFEPRISAQSDGTSAFELATRAHFASTRALLAAGKDKEAAQVNAPMIPWLTPDDYFDRYIVTLSPCADYEISNILGDTDAGKQTSKPYEENLSDENIAVTVALKIMARVQMAQGDTDGALTNYEHAATSAGKVGTLIRGHPSSYDGPALIGEVTADIFLGHAQTLHKASRYEEAEKKLEEALTAAEAVSGARHPRVGLVLLAIARVYARTRRISFAEGLYKEASKLLNVHVGPPGQAKPSSQGPKAHASIVALLCWQNAQLLTALPKRGTEAGWWEETARSAWKDAGGLNKSSIEGTLGSMDQLTGTGEPGSGVIIDLMLRRALPMAAQ